MKDSPKPNPETEPDSPPVKSRPDKDAAFYLRRHLSFGWWSLLVFLTLGLVLEGLHGFKAGMYLDVSNSTRRLMWTLAHAHGALCALINLAFAATVSLVPGWNARARDVASACLLGASVLLPGGFFLGGVVIYDGDPGLGILLVPPGAGLLFIAVFLAARAARAPKSAAGIVEAGGGKRKSGGKN